METECINSEVGNNCSMVTNEQSAAGRPGQSPFLKDCWCSARCPALSGVSSLLASLGPTGRRGVVLGHTLGPTLMKTDEQKKGVKSIYDFLLGLIHSHPGPHAAHQPMGYRLDTPVRCSESVPISKL